MKNLFFEATSHPYYRMLIMRKNHDYSALSIHSASLFVPLEILAKALWVFLRQDKDKRLFAVVASKDYFESKDNSLGPQLYNLIKLGRSVGIETGCKHCLSFEKWPIRMTENEIKIIFEVWKKMKDCP